MRNLLNSILGGFGRTFGRFLFYLLVGLLVYLIFDKWEVNALTNTRDIVEVNVTTTNFSLGGSNTLTLRPATTGDLFVYEDQYFSDRRLNGYYLLGWNEYIFGDYSYYTSNINFYYPNSCNANENVNYNIRIRFYNQDVFTLKPNITSGSSTCTGTIETIGKDFDYILNCNTRPGSPIIGSLYFTKVGVYPTNYRVSIQKNFNYSCEVNSQAIIENDNINTDRTIQAITDMNGNVTIVNNSINNLNDSINDDTPPSDTELTNFFDTLRDDFPTNNTISQLLLLPLNILHIFLTNIQNGCSPFILPYRFGNYEQNYSMKCVTIKDLVKDDNVVNIIDLGMIIGLFFTFSQTIINMWNTLIHLRDEFDEQYVPQHVGGPRYTRGKMRGDY